MKTIRGVVLAAALALLAATSADASHCWRCVTPGLGGGSAKCVKASHGGGPSFASCLVIGASCTLGSACQPTLADVDAAGILHKSAMSHGLSRTSTRTMDFAPGTDWSEDCSGNVVARKMDPHSALKLRAELAHINV